MGSYLPCYNYGKVNKTLNRNKRSQGNVQVWNSRAARGPDSNSEARSSDSERTTDSDGMLVEVVIKDHSQRNWAKTVKLEIIQK